MVSALIMPVIQTPTLLRLIKIASGPLYWGYSRSVWFYEKSLLSMQLRACVAEIGNTVDRLLHNPTTWLTGAIPTSAQSQQDLTLPYAVRAYEVKKWFELHGLAQLQQTLNQKAFHFLCPRNGGSSQGGWLFCNVLRRLRPGTSAALVARWLLASR